MSASLPDLRGLTAQIVGSHVTRNSVAVSELPALITRVYDALAALGTPPSPDVLKPAPAVSIRSSVKPDYIVCLEDGRRLKILKRHLMTNFGMTPEAYRSKWNLPSDYPMVAPNYAARRSELARQIGLGTTRRESVAVDKPLPLKTKRADTVPRGPRPASRSKQSREVRSKGT